MIKEQEKHMETSGIKNKSKSFELKNITQNFYIFLVNKLYKILELVSYSSKHPIITLAPSQNPFL